MNGVIWSEMMKRIFGGLDPLRGVCAGWDAIATGSPAGIRKSAAVS